MSPSLSTAHAHSHLEGYDATHSVGKKLSVENRRAGRPRGQRSMGRYPFLTCAKEYLERVGPTLSNETARERERRYRRMAKDFEELHKAGKVSSHNPEKLTDMDVIAFVGLLKTRGMSGSGILHEISALKKLLEFVGNGAAQTAKVRMPTSFPKQSRQRLPPMTERERNQILEAAERVPKEDWRRLQAFAMTVMAISTGLRSKELRLCNREDLDVASWTIHAEEVKGKGTYGEPRDVPIDPDGHGIILRYLEARDAMVATTRPELRALFPAIGDAKGDGYFTTNSLSKLRAIVKDETGVEYDGRKCRRTFGQKCIDDGMPLEDVSLFLGHNTTRTTEGSYCRKRPTVAMEEARRIWHNRVKAADIDPVSELRPQPTRVNSPMIEKRRWEAGYA